MKLLPVLLSSLLLASCASSKSVDHVTTPPQLTGDARLDDMRREAQQFLGYPDEYVKISWGDLNIGKTKTEVYGTFFNNDKSIVVDTTIKSPPYTDLNLGCVVVHELTHFYQSRRGVDLSLEQNLPHDERSYEKEAIQACDDFWIYEVLRGKK